MEAKKIPWLTPLAQRLLPLVYGLVLVIALILGLTWGALQVQITLAGFLNGESIWSKAQKQAVIDLEGYASSGNPSDLEDFRRNYAIVQADAAARDAIASGDYDAAQVARDFRNASVIPQAIPGMIFILDHFRSAPYMGEALRAWYSVNPQIAELDRIATHLQALYATSPPSEATIARMRERIRQLNQSIEPQSNDFSLQIARGAAWVGHILFVLVLGAATAALLLWMLMARRVLAGIRGSEERYRLLFDSAPDAIVMVDEDSGRVVDANRSARDWTGHDRKSLIGVDYESLFVHGLTRRGSSGSGDLRGRDGETRPIETLTNTVVWGDKLVRQSVIRDISDRVERDRARRIAAEALASIAEGVIIADAKRLVLSVNAAATKMTGFTQAKLAGRRLDATRTLADGNLLPPAVWDEVIATDHWSGEVVSHRVDGSTYPEALRISTIRDDEHRVLYYVAVFNDITVAKADRRRLEQLASQDALSGLANRASFERQCEAAIASARDRHAAAAVMFIDLDAFKFVNDSYSHAVGDRLLKLVAERITRQLRDGDVAGRIGGDEFTVLLPQLAMREDAAALASRMLSTLSEPFRIDEYEIVVSASIGIAGYPLDGENAKMLIANADAAMYAAKSEERNTWRFYVPTMRADSHRRMLLATELRRALQESEFRIAFQPGVEMDTGRILGAEALLRWDHPDRGEVMPGEFIPVAEGIGLIHRIDEWVMHAVCEQIHAWDQAGVPQVEVAINVSARWFGHPGFVQSLRHALQVNAVAPGRIVLEITEGAMLRLGEETRNTMRALKELGVAVAIDDFGTGYASMAYLKLPAVKYLKIDRSFITGLPDSPDDAAITTAMLAMAKSLGLVAVAEGIETEAQHEFLQRAGCTHGQGYLYAYPLQPREFERMLRPKQPPGGARLKLVPAVRRSEPGA